MHGIGFIARLSLTPERPAMGASSHPARHGSADVAVLHCRIPALPEPIVTTPSFAADVAHSHVLAALAIECAQAQPPARCVLERGEAEALAAALAADAARHTAAAGLDLVMVGALYDQAQLLRPGWPVHAALADARTRIGEGGGRVIALGAHDGRLPAPALQPDLRLHGSPLLVLPWLLAGPADACAATGARFERELLERGLADAGLSLAVGAAFGVEVAHARLLTVFDLCALCCAQYEHAGLGALWQMIETALLRPHESCTATLDDGGTLRWNGDAVHADTPDARLRAHANAVFAAHGIALADA